MPRIPAAQRRSEFIEAAVEVIATHGIEGATTRRIAEQAGANLALLHYCYDSKEALFGDVFDLVSGKYRDVIEASDPHAGLPETARAILRGVMEFYLESSTFTATAMELISWARRQHEDGGIAVYEKALETVRGLLRRAAGDQDVSAETIDEIATVLSTLADGFALTWFTYEDRDAAVRQIEVADSVLGSWLAARLQPAAAPA